MLNSRTPKYSLNDPAKFRDPLVTASGEERAVVSLANLQTVWFNTGSLCNITCKNCFMGSSPQNDDLNFLKTSVVTKFLDEIKAHGFPVEEIGFTGGEPFMNKDLMDMINEALKNGFRVLVLTNAMTPLKLRREQLCSIRERYGGSLVIRVSIDHYTPERHEKIRGVGTWKPMIEGLRWLSDKGFNLAIAGRTCWGEPDATARKGFQDLFRREGIDIDENDPAKLVLFPEMDMAIDVPEITVGCWDLLGVKPEEMMCASSRMVVHRRGESHPVVVPCTLLPYDKGFELGNEIAKSARSVRLNHPYCARFCVLGGASCNP